MMLKKPKEQLLKDIESKVFSITYNQLSQLSNTPMNNMHYTIQRAVQDAITMAMRELIENLYTDAEFEQDLGLK